MNILDNLNLVIPIAVKSKKQKKNRLNSADKNKQSSIVQKDKIPKDRPRHKHNKIHDKQAKEPDKKKKFIDEPDKKKSRKNVKKTIDDKVDKDKDEVSISLDLSYELKLADESYARHSLVYKQAMSQYLQTKTAQTAYSVYDEEKDMLQQFFDTEVITYEERKEVVRVIQMNALMHGEHNYVAPELKTSYKYWKWARKENEQISFTMHDGVFR